MSNHSAHVRPAPDPSEAAISRWHHHVDRMTTRRTPTLPALKQPLERPRTVKEAAAELGLSVYTVRAWVACRRLAHIRLGRAIRIPAAELRRVLDENLIPAESE
jgi:excisionase family DNA binding protein